LIVIWQLQRQKATHENACPVKTITC